MSRQRTLMFGPLTIAYDESSLEPRPWTQLQARWAADLLTGLPSGPVLELCAGVGHIGLRAVLDSDRRLVQVDVDENACRFARRNADATRAADRIEVRCRELAGAAGPDERFVLVIADPPWVRSDEVAGLDDPEDAVDGGADGLDIARDCLTVAAAHLDEAGDVLLQVGGPAQVAGIEQHVAAHPELRLQVAGHRLAPDGEDGAVIHLARVGVN